VSPPAFLTDSKDEEKNAAILLIRRTELLGKINQTRGGEVARLADTTPWWELQNVTCEKKGRGEKVLVVQTLLRR
jgi:hypothetical protein